MKLVKAAQEILRNGNAKATLAVALALFVLSAVSDEMLYRSGVPAASTYLNDIVIGVTGGICAGLILSYQASRDAIERARERMLLTTELNHQLRNVMTTMASSALLPDETDRLRAMDEAVERADEVLTGIVATSGSRFSRN